jgi:hypothetical protein
MARMKPIDLQMRRFGVARRRIGPMAELTDKQKRWIDDMIKKSGLNEFGDPKDTMYAGGTPLFDEKTGTRKDRYAYIIGKHKDWLPR